MIWHAYENDNWRKIFLKIYSRQILTFIFCPSHISNFVGNISAAEKHKSEWINWIFRRVSQVKMIFLVPRTLGEFWSKSLIQLILGRMVCLPQPEAFLSSFSFSLSSLFSSSSLCSSSLFSSFCSSSSSEKESSVQGRIRRRSLKVSGIILTTSPLSW